MKLLFFHNSQTIRIDEFRPLKNGVGEEQHNFYWIDDRYHSYTPYGFPDNFIHIFIADPWMENYDFHFMQGISKSEDSLRQYYSEFALTHHHPTGGTAPILRIKTTIWPNLIGEHEGDGRYNFGGEKIRLLDGAIPIPFISTKLMTLLGLSKEIFPISYFASLEEKS